MPNPMHCDRLTVKNGRTKVGTQRYKCKICGKTFAAEPKPKSVPKILDRPLTANERKRRSRNKLNWREELK